MGCITSLALTGELINQNLWNKAQDTPKHVWSSGSVSYDIANAGGQIEVDACTGGLTLMESVTDYLDKPYYAIHDSCGGETLLSLDLGDEVSIANTAYRVVYLQLVQRGDTAAHLNPISSDVLIQTCYPDKRGMRILGLEALR